jgi:YD repeat-containing protein
MPSDNPVYSYDQLGRLTNVVWPNGAMATYSYDAMGNRTSVVEVPGTPPTPVIPTVTAFPKRCQSDFKNDPMVVLLSDGQLIGWADNTTAVLANGVEAATNSLAQRVVFDPNTTPPPLAATIVDWAFTNANLYVVYSNGWVYSAGSNSYGQLGKGDTTDRSYLSRIEYFVSNSLSVIKVWAQGGYTTTNGGGSVFFQASDYSMYGCGLNTAGQLGNSTTPTSNVSTPAPCAGIGHTTNHVVDVKMATVSTFISAYMLFNDGTLFVAGYNAQGQLGINSTTNQTGTFVSAVTGSGNVTNAASISANGGSTTAGNALFVDTSGNVWTSGYNTHGELGLGTTTAVHLFTKSTALSGIARAEIVGGLSGFGYALTTSGVLWTWGFNGLNNLYKNNSTTPQSTPAAAPFPPPGVIANVFYSRGQQGLATTQQLILLMTNGTIAYAGADIGQEPIANTVYPGSYSLIAMPPQIMNGTDTISDIFVHGTGLTQRWFILTGSGKLYACGQNNDAICMGAIATTTAQLNAVWQEIAFSP